MLRVISGQKEEFFFRLCGQYSRDFCSSGVLDDFDCCPSFDVLLRAHGAADVSFLAISAKTASLLTVLADDVCRCRAGSRMHHRQILFITLSK